MKTQEYIKANGLQKLVDDFQIIVTDYPDRVVLNYNQIESPRFNPIVDECRALILRKDTWEVMSRAFDRFYNVGEGETWKTFDVSKSRIDEKLDGSLLSVYWDGEKWCVSTRKMAFGEGTSTFGKTFRELFDIASKKTNLWLYLLNNSVEACRFTWIFELTSPESRVVHPYADTEITLIGGRNLHTGDEIDGKSLNIIAQKMMVKRPLSYRFENIEQALEAAKSLNSMDEGFVLVSEHSGSFDRVKCKNPKFVAIAHMRENGGISPKRILTLIMANDQEEYLQYFSSDKPYFDFVERIFNESTDRIHEIAEKHMGIVDQKEFALTIIPLVKYEYEKGILFSMRKSNRGSIQSFLDKLGSKKLAAALNLRNRFASEFKIQIEEE